jgi:DNA-binding transcriptional MerR regulator
LWSADSQRPSCFFNEEHIVTEIENSEGPRTYQIGTVSSLTGIDAHTIRAWERRYGAIKPMRSESGRRLYSDETVERLQLLKGLVDCNEAISTISDLSDDQLRQRLERLAEHEEQATTRGIPAQRYPGRPSIGLCAPALEIQISASAVSLIDLEICLRQDVPQRLLDGLRQTPLEVVLLELESLTDSAPDIVEACRSTPGAPQVIVLYRFAQRGELARVARAGATIVQTPIRLESLRRIILDQAMIGRARSRRFQRSSDAVLKSSSKDSTARQPLVPPRRLDDAQLARLLEITSAIECECPNHLSSLISGLVAFETYSRECESRDAADSAQHRRLADGTAAARSRMEDLLIELCDHEGIAI